jgi:hypothetical protein
MLICKKEKFTLIEQLWMQISFNGMWILGVKEHNSCLQAPPILTKFIIKKYMQKPLKTYEKILFLAAIYGVFIFPMYWILKINYLIIPFLILGLMQYLGFYFHFCRTCFNSYCPQNSNKSLNVS